MRLLIYVFFFQRDDITNCFTRFHAIFGYLTEFFYFFVYFLIYFFVYLEGGGRFKLQFGLCFHFQKFELNLRLWRFENCAVISPQCNGGDGFQGGHLRAYYNRSQKTRPAWVCLDASQDPRRVGVKLEISEPPKRKYVFYFLSLWSQLLCSVNYQTRNSNLDERPTLMYSTTTIHFTTKIWTSQNCAVLT